MAGDALTGVTVGQARRAIDELKKQGGLDDKVSDEEAGRRLFELLGKAKGQQSTAQSIEGTGTTVMSSTMRGLGKLVSGPLGLMEGTSKLTGGALRAVGADTLAGAAESVGATAGELGRISDRDLAQAYQPDPHDVIAEPGVGQFLKQTAPGLAGQTAAILGTGGAAGAPAAMALASATFGGASWQEAKDNGATDAQAAGAMMIGIGAGVAQAALLGRIALRSPTMMAKLANSAALGGTNLGIEGLQDEYAKLTYDPERKVLAGWKENLGGTVVMSLVGGAMGGHGSAPERSSVDLTGKGRPMAEQEAGAQPAKPQEATLPFTKEPVDPAREAEVRLSEAPTPQAEAPSPTPEAPSSAPELHGPFLLGKDTGIVLDDGRTIPGKYAVVEADSLTPSHDARKGFRKNDGGDVNERPYDDPTEGKPYRQTVEKIAGQPNPALLHTDTPTAIDGPPIVTDQGVVLGGNARTMGVQLAYSRGGATAEALRGATRRAIEKFGIAGADGLKDPVIVRVVQPGMEGAPGELSRSLNAALTTGRTPLTDAISRGSKVTPETAGAIAGIVGDGSLREAMGDPTAAKRIMRELVDTGALSATDVVTMTDTRGLPTQAGRDLIEHTLLGSVVPDIRALAGTTADLKGALVKAVPHLLAIETAWPGFKQKLALALDGMASLRLGKKTLTVDQAVSTPMLIPEGWRTEPIAIQMMRAFESDGPNSLARRFSNIAEGVADIASGQSHMFFDPAERTVQSVFDLNMPGSGVDPAIKLIQPVEVARPTLVGDNAPNFTTMYGGVPPGPLAKILGLEPREVATSRPPSRTLPGQQEFPFASEPVDNRALVRKWNNRRHEGDVHAKVEQQKSVDQLRALVERPSLRQAIATMFGKTPRDEAVKKLSGAMTHWVQNRSNLDAVRAKAALLTDPEFKPFADRAMLAMDLPNDVRAIAERVRQEQNAESKRYLDENLIASVIDDYVTQVWGAQAGEQPRGVRGSNRMSQSSPRQLKRDYPTLLDGLLDMQERKRNGEPYRLPVTDSLLDLQRIKREQLSALIENRNLMSWSLKNGIVSPWPNPDAGWKAIPHEGFRKYIAVGKLTEGKVTTQVAPEDKPFLPGLEDGQIIPEASLDLWGPGILKTADGTILMKPQLYAAPEFADALNRALNKSDLEGNVVYRALRTINDVVREQVLAYDWSHHLTITGRAMLTMPGMKGMNPAAMYRAGKAAMEAHAPDIALGIRNNLRLGYVPDWTDLQHSERTRIGKIIEKIPISREVQAFADSVRRWQEQWLFGTYIPSLKSQSFLLELNSLRKTHASKLKSGAVSDDQLATMAANLANDVFGGQNLVAHNRHPTTQALFRLIDLAPDWRESSVRVGLGGLKPGMEGDLYRHMWARAATRAFVAAAAWNLLMGSIANDDKETYWQHIQGAWKQGRLPMFEADITPLLKATGANPSGRKYISLLGKMDELYRLTSGQAIQNARYRMSPLTAAALSLGMGENAYGSAYTTTAQLTGHEDRGEYKDFSFDPKTGNITLPGMEKPQKLTGKLTVPGMAHKGVGEVSQIPSWAADTALNAQPAAMQDMVRLMLGQTGALEAIMRAVGFPIQTERKEKKK